METCDRCKRKFLPKDVCPIIGLCLRCENKYRRKMEKVLSEHTSDYLEDLWNMGEDSYDTRMGK